jgi:hypothetical protein
MAEGTLTTPDLMDDRERSRGARLRRARGLPFVVVGLLTLLACLVCGRFGPPGHQPMSFPLISSWLGREVALPSGWFIALFGAIWALGLAATLLFPRGLTRRGAAAVILALALGSRLLLLPHPPSDDVHRYLWEGRILAAGFSPYTHPPRAEGDPTVDPYRDPSDPIWQKINHPTMTAIYPPAMLALFAGVASVGYDPLAVKATMVFFDLATLLVLLLILEHRRLEARWALLYAQSPVVLVAFAGEGHLDAVQVFLIVLALYLYQRRCWGLMWVALGLAFQAKYVALLGWPFFLTRESWRTAWAAALVAAVPLLLALWLDGPAVFASLRAFGTGMAFNGSVHALLRALLGETPLSTQVCMVLYGLLYLVGLRCFHPWWPSTRPDPASGLFFVFGALLVLSPTVHFWYLAWVLPFVALRPTASWVVLLATVGFTFVTWGLEHQTGTWSYPWWGPWAVWTLPLLLMARDLRLFVSRCRGPVEAKAPETVSVVVPTRDEEERIAGCIEAIRRDPAVVEVIVVDGGSTDGTAELAEAAGARVVEHLLPYDRGGGRGGQIHAGVALARGDVVAIVHADTAVEPATFSRVLERLGANPDVAGGAVGSVFDGAGLTVRLLEVANDLRAAFLGISFGDQVQFFRRWPALARGALPDIPLMEDVELGLRLHRLGRVCFLWGEARVSPRRWQRGAARRVLLVIGLMSEYLLRRLFGRPDTSEMYRRYYLRGR